MTRHELGRLAFSFLEKFDVLSDQGNAGVPTDQDIDSVLNAIDAAYEEMVWRSPRHMWLSRRGVILRPPEQVVIGVTQYSNTITFPAGWQDYMQHCAIEIPGESGINRLQEQTRLLRPVTRTTDAALTCTVYYDTYNLSSTETNVLEPVILNGDKELIQDEDLMQKSPAEIGTPTHWVAHREMETTQVDQTDSVDDWAFATTYYLGQTVHDPTATIPGLYRCLTDPSHNSAGANIDADYAAGRWELVDSTYQTHQSRRYLRVNRLPPEAMTLEFPSQVLPMKWIKEWLVGAYSDVQPGSQLGLGVPLEWEASILVPFVMQRLTKLMRFEVQATARTTKEDPLLAQIFKEYEDAIQILETMCVDTTQHVMTSTWS